MNKFFKSISKSDNWIWAVAGVLLIWWLSQQNPPLVSSPTQLTQAPNPLAGMVIVN